MLFLPIINIFSILHKLGFTLFFPSWTSTKLCRRSRSRAGPPTNSRWRPPGAPAVENPKLCPGGIVPLVQIYFFPRSNMAELDRPTELDLTGDDGIHGYPRSRVGFRCQTVRTGITLQSVPQWRVPQEGQRAQLGRISVKLGIFSRTELTDRRGRKKSSRVHLLATPTSKLN